ncbi:MAG: tRNA 2-thiouridine(34) synthase MnmA [Anaerolineae bacterium]|nr:tRNA 2-thiouridine(34) synthase MnmA [Anaerolineae bacterium]
MSGGVDSSVTAALLVQQGYDVIGMMMRLWSENCDTEGGSGGPVTSNRCCTPDQMADARRIADQLGIPFYVIDTQDVFRRTIVQFFTDRYAAGDTPNPCLECNRHIRFEWLLNHALALDANFLATGHYARVQRDPAGDPASPVRLLRGLDPGKDQSYVLSVLTQDKLRHAMFPIGEYEKPRVRELAAEFGLPVASKHDSQDLCFLADGDYRRFLREHIPAAMQPGPILLRDHAQTDGEFIGEFTELGQHTGLPNYTIGQRKGLGLSYHEPLYVLGSDPARNALIVGPREMLGANTLIAERMNWIAGSPPVAEGESLRADVQIRYTAQAAPATVFPLPPDEHGDRMRVVFDEPLRDITPGQGAVVYVDDECLGGGIIARVER